MRENKKANFAKTNANQVPELIS